MRNMQEGEIWVANIAERGGHGQYGTRPSLLVTSVKDGLVFAVPFTTNLKAQRYTHSVLIKPTPQNGLREPSVALVLHMISLDENDLTHKLGSLEDSTFQQILDEIAALFKRAA